MVDVSPGRELLARRKLSELLKPQNVVTVKDNASVEQALRVSTMSICML